MTDASLPVATPTPLWRRLLPVLFGVGLLGWVLLRLDFPTFVSALQRTRYGAFLGFAVAFNGALLATDTLATVRVYSRVVGPVRYRDLFSLRAASYLPSILNHHVGQAWLTYYLARTAGVPLGRAAGATLLVYATTFGALYAFLLAGTPFHDGRLEWLLPTVGGVGFLGLGYLGVIFLRPAALAARPVVGVLFEAGVRGHLRALAWRLPHVGVQFFGAWVPFWFFGVRIPLEDALVLMPLLMFVVTLPVSPQGLGTRETLSIALLSGYAAGSPDERAATLAATTLSWLSAITLVQLVLSPLFWRRATGLLVAAVARPPEPS